MMASINIPKLSPGLALDIDETLSWTLGHWVAELQKHCGNPENLSVKELIKKYRYTWNVPYWQTDEARAFIQQLMHADEVCEILPLIEGAPSYVNKVHSIIPISVYLTNRPENVGNGTGKWLAQHGFPLAPIICRPKHTPHEKGNEWKASILRESYPTIQGIVDDNIGLIKFLEPDYPGITFLYDHASIESKINVVACKDWKTVYQEVKKAFGVKKSQ